MSIDFTPDQERVIQLQNCSTLVSAAAGSGKTAVLVERIVRMVCDDAHPVDIDRLLVVTFTNAAAAEMRERIAAGIAARLQEHPESEHIQRQATLLHNAQITTIHSFSLFLIRNHFHEIGLDPAFRVADEGEIKLLRQDVLGELLEDLFREGSGAFLHCVEYFCSGGRERVLEEHILNLSRYADSHPWPLEWLQERKKDYAAQTVEELLNSPCGQYLKGHLFRMLGGCIEKMETAHRLCESPDGPYMFGALVDGELEQLRRLRECDTMSASEPEQAQPVQGERRMSLMNEVHDTITELGAGLSGVCFGRLSSKKDDSVSPVKRELVKKIRDEVKKTLQGMAEKYFRTPLELAAAQAGECAAPIEMLIDITIEFDRRMRQAKREKKIIDFSDMEHFALEILTDREEGIVRPSAVALEYRQFFHEILIDEYQDSNLVQEYLLQMISGEEDGRYNRFMVGDVKQSIYKFRLARPELFLEKYRAYREDEGDCRRIDLTQNFRSRSSVVDTVNSVFRRMMSQETGGIAYDERAALYAGAKYPESEGCESELLLVEKPGKEEDLGAKESEALAIANKIKDLRGHFQVTDKADGRLRPVRYSDMVILLRTNSGWDEEFRAVLEREGIPVHIASKTGYFAATEVQELLHVLRVLDNPTQDIPLFGMMKSVFGGFSEAEIARIRGGRKKGSLYSALCGFMTDAAFDAETSGWRMESPPGDAVEGESGGAVKISGTDRALAERVAEFLENLKKYRFYTTYMPIRELLQKLVEDYDYLNYVTALPAGGKRRANVEMLFTKASDFEKTSYFGLFHFVRYMEQLEKYEVDYGEADTLDENADVVRIMSIHKSKGLEFPVTFVAGLAKRFNMQDVNQSLIVDMDLGIGMDYVDPVKRIRNKTLRRSVLARKMREESLAEELRVFYVAVTRAREKLILSAAVEKPEEQWALCREYAAEGLTYLDYIEAAGLTDFLFPVLAGTDLQVKIISKGDSARESMQEQMELSVKKSMLERAAYYADEEALQRIRSRFAFVYPYRSLEKLYTKTTVSELKIAAMADKDEAAYHNFEEKEIVPYIPAFRREQESVSGTVRGNAFHRAMEILDFQKLLGVQFAQFPPDYESYNAGLDDGRLADDLRAFLEKETEVFRLSREYLNALNQRKVLRFLRTPLAYRMWAADRRGELYREQPFVLGISAGRLGEEFPAEEKVLIQGIIDVFFVEERELVLLDYKTDVVRSMGELWNRYGTQLQYYEEALRSLMGMSVKEKILYSFHLECGER